MPDSSYFVGPQTGLPASPMGQPITNMGNNSNQVPDFLKILDRSTVNSTQQFNLNQNSLSSGAQQVTGAFDQGATGPFKSLWNYVSGTGALNVGDDTGTLSISPGGSFNLRSPQGFGITGNPAMKSLGVNVPVGGGSSKGTVGLQGSWGTDPSIQANFQFGQRTPSFSSPEQAVNNALGPAEQPAAQVEPSARNFLDQMIDKYRSSEGRDPNSPTSWQE